MKLPAVAYSAEVATLATKAGSCRYLVKFSEATTPFAKATEGSPRLHPRSSLLRRSSHFGSHFGCEGWKLRGIRRRRINGSVNLRLGDRAMNGDDGHVFTQTCVIVCKLGMYAQREQSGDMLWRPIWIANFS